LVQGIGLDKYIFVSNNVIVVNCMGTLKHCQIAEALLAINHINVAIMVHEGDVTNPYWQ